jgi:hypothetical protein
MAEQGAGGFDDGDISDVGSAKDDAHGIHTEFGAICGLRNAVSSRAGMVTVKIWQSGLKALW